MSALGPPSDSADLVEWLAWLETLSPREIDLGLERVSAVLERLELAAPSRLLLVGGTNGKGSTVAWLEALYREAGWRVACYTSPHVLRFNERMRVDGRDLDDRQIVTALQRVESQRQGAALTYFEYGTLAALDAFALMEAQVVILEVGLGGRLDAVNAVEPDGVIITNVTLDHCDWLGHDVESIAREKAGIMRAAKPAVFASGDVPEAIEAAATELAADLLLPGRDYRFGRQADHWGWQGSACSLEGLRPPALRGEFQYANAAGALALYAALEGHEGLTAAAVNRALGAPVLPGRLQRVGTRWLLDVAHNPAAASVLAAELAATCTGVTAVIGTLADKDLDGILTPLLPLVDHWIAVTADNPRALPAASVAAGIRALGGGDCAVAASIFDALALAEQRAAPQHRLLVTGSFFVVGPALSVLTSAPR